MLGCLPIQNVPLERMRLKTQSKTGKKAALAELDAAVRNGIRLSAQERSPSSLRQPDLSTIVRWKLMRGKFRPRLQQFADAVPSKALEHASSVVIDLVRHHDLEEVVRYGCDAGRAVRVETAIRDCLQPLTEIKGVGPATASAVIMASTDGIPFMVDELLELLGPRVYTPACYATMLIAASNKAAALNRHTAAGDDATAGKRSRAAHVPAPVAEAAAAFSAAADGTLSSGAEETADDAAPSAARVWTARDVCDAIWAVARLPDPTAVKSRLQSLESTSITGNCGPCTEIVLAGHASQSMETAAASPVAAAASVASERRASGGIEARAKPPKRGRD
jgi:hypothetical protein